MEILSTKVSMGPGLGGLMPIIKSRGSSERGRRSSRSGGSSSRSGKSRA